MPRQRIINPVGTLLERNRKAKKIRKAKEQYLKSVKKFIKNKDPLQKKTVQDRIKKFNDAIRDAQLGWD